MIIGFQVSQALHVAATLGISDELAAAPRTAADLAAATSTHEPTLARLMRALAGLGVYEQDAEGRFSNTQLGELLRSDVPGSMAGWAAFIGRPPYWQAWSSLLDSVRTGENAFAAVHGTPVWEYRRQRPAEQEAFDRAMTSNSSGVAKAVVEAYDFGRFTTVADVGGGVGALLAAVLRRYPSVRGVLYDQAEVVASAGPLFERAGVGDRCELAAGSFFESVPPGADAYVLKAIIHDWPDAESIAILRRCQEVMHDDAVLLLVEQILGAGADPVITPFSDLNMLVGPGGRERTLDEYRDLLETAGLRLTEVTDTGHARLRHRGEASAELVEVAREHVEPGTPVVLPLRAPGVDPVRDLLATEDGGRVPGLADVLPGPFARRQDREAGPEGVELGPFEVRQEVRRRRQVEVLAERRIEEAVHPVGAAHADRRPEGVRVPAQDGEGVEGADRGAGDDDGRRVPTQVGADCRHHLVDHALLELVEQPHLVLRRAVLGHQCLTGHAVTGVELDPAAPDELAAGRHKTVALDLLCVTAGCREDEHRRPVVAPAREADRLLEPLRVPPVGHLHVRSWGVLEPARVQPASFPHQGQG